ncbi:MAG: glycosyltransferase [Patescibacteria group bacterium]
MKIVHLIGYFQPEFGYKEYYIAKNQVKLGHEVYVITSDKIFPFPNLPQLAKSLNISANRERPQGLQIIDGIKVYRQPIIFELGGSVLIKGVKKLLREIKPDIVHSYEPVQLTPILAGRYKSLGYKLYAEHQMFELPRTLLGRLYFQLVTRFFSRYILKRADKILFPTLASRDFSLKRWQFAPAKIAMTPLGYDPERFHFNERARTEIRQRFNYSDQDKVIITAGKIEQGKNYELILKAMVELKDQWPVKLLMVGSGDQKYLDSIKELAKELGLGERVSFEGFVSNDQLYRYYSAADLGIWPHLPSITIIEAMGCQLPLLLPDWNTVTHLVKKGNGRLFKINDYRELKNQLGRILNEEDYHQVKLAAQEVAPDFSYQKIADRILTGDYQDYFEMD